MTSRDILMQELINTGAQEFRFSCVFANDSETASHFSVWWWLVISPGKSYVNRKIKKNFFFTSLPWITV